VTPSSDATTPSEASRLADLAGAVELLRDVVRLPVPVGLSGAAAQQYVSLFSEAERAAASGVALFAPVVVETGEYTKSGHGSAADWLGSLSGSSKGAAKGRLAAATRAAKDPRLTEALHEGELSADQLKLVANSLSETPEASAGLLDLLDQGASHRELSDAADRMRAASRSIETERLRRARVHTNRHFRWGQDEHGGIRGGFFCDEVEFARVAPRLEAEAKRRWKAAGNGHGVGVGDSLEAHRLDAFIDLLSGSSGFSSGDDDDGADGAGGDEDRGGGDEDGEGGGRDGGGPDGDGGHRRGRGPLPRALIIVNAESLRRGTTEGDELCEIEGIGPVSVAAAKELLSEGGFQYLVKEGFDIKTVTKSTRVISNCIDMALGVRDRVCARPGCGNRLGLERDHWRLDYGKDGPTELENLVRLCPDCHKLKTDGGWRLEGGPGAWEWVAPAKPPSAAQMARTRKVAVAKAKAKSKSNSKAFVKKDPSGPRPT
jgi:HNH endonuclease